MRLKASVTIFLSLVITVVIVVVCTVIESARISVSQMEGKAATSERHLQWTTVELWLNG